MDRDFAAFFAAPGKIYSRRANAHCEDDPLGECLTHRNPTVTLAISAMAAGGDSEWVDVEAVLAAASTEMALGELVHTKNFRQGPYNCFCHAAAKNAHLSW